LAASLKRAVSASSGQIRCGGLSNCQIQVREIALATSDGPKVVSA
jgi:hypothetical protein